MFSSNTQRSVQLELDYTGMSPTQGVHEPGGHKRKFLGLLTVNMKLPEEYFMMVTPPTTYSRIFQCNERETMAQMKVYEKESSFCVFTLPQTGLCDDCRGLTV